MSDEDALLAAIAAHPVEDTSRLAYADWLEEHGHPARAEFIRVQIEVARVETLPRVILNRYVDLFRRQQELIDDHTTELLGPLAVVPLHEPARFERGFVSEIQISVADFLDHAPVIATIRPLPTVAVLGVAARLGDFVRCEHLGCVAHISGWSGSMLDPPSWPLDRELLIDAASRLTRLRSLDLEDCGLDDEFCEQLNNFSLPALVELDLSNNGITDAGVANLLRTRFPRQLERLVLGGNPISDAGAITLAEQWPTGDGDRLQYLNLRFTNIGVIGHRVLTARFGGRLTLF